MTRLTLESFRKSAASPIPFEQLVACTAATFAIVASLRSGRSVEVAPLRA